MISGGLEYHRPTALGTAFSRPLLVMQGEGLFKWMRRHANDSEPYLYPSRTDGTTDQLVNKRTGVVSLQILRMQQQFDGLENVRVSCWLEPTYENHQAPR